MHIVTGFRPLICLSSSSHHDYNATSSALPVASLVVNPTFARATTSAIDHMDVVTAFLNPEVDDPYLYMAIPEGWDSSSSGNDSTGGGGNSSEVSAAALSDYGKPCTD